MAASLQPGIRYRLRTCPIPNTDSGPHDQLQVQGLSCRRACPRPPGARAARAREGRGRTDRPAPHRGRRAHREGSRRPWDHRRGLAYHAAGHGGDGGPQGRPQDRSRRRRHRRGRGDRPGRRGRLRARPVDTRGGQPRLRPAAGLQPASAEAGLDHTLRRLGAGHPFPGGQHPRRDARHSRFRPHREGPGVEGAGLRDEGRRPRPVPAARGVRGGGCGARLVRRSAPALRLHIGAQPQDGRDDPHVRRFRLRKDEEALRTSSIRLAAPS